MTKHESVFNGLPEITDEDRQFLHYNPNTDDLVEFVRQYAEKAILAKQAAQVEPGVWPERVMQQWDYWRKQIANGDKTSAPRDWFESLAPTAEAQLERLTAEQVGQAICDQARCSRGGDEGGYCTVHDFHLQGIADALNAVLASAPTAEALVQVGPCTCSDHECGQCMKPATEAQVEPVAYRVWNEAKGQWELTSEEGWPAQPLYITPPATSALVEAAEKALETLESLQGGCTDSNDGTVEALTVWCPEVCEELRAALEAEKKGQV